jgi:hypothetical protein
MYCPVCGADNQQSVKFCKRCGASMSLPSTRSRSDRSRSDITPDKLTGMFWSVAILSLGGLGVILGCMVPLLALGIDQKMMGILALFGFVTIFGIAGLLIRQLSRLISIAQANPAQAANPNMTAEYVQPQITDQPRQVSSVTEHTTRNFDPIYKEQRTRE